MSPDRHMPPQTGSSTAPRRSIRSGMCGRRRHGRRAARWTGARRDSARGAYSSRNPSDVLASTMIHVFPQGWLPANDEPMPQRQHSLSAADTVDAYSHSRHWRSSFNLHANDDPPRPLARPPRGARRTRAQFQLHEMRHAGIERPRGRREESERATTNVTYVVRILKIFVSARPALACRSRRCRGAAAAFV